MSGRKEKTKGPKRSGARRRVKARSALLLTLLSALLVFLWRALRATAFSGLDGVAAMLADALVTVAAFALPAALATGLGNGTYKGIVLYADDTTALHGKTYSTNFARFSADASLTITWTV